MKVPLIIRKAELQDAEQLLAIYAPYVRNTAITFEYDVPTVEAFRQRMAGVCKHYPWLVAVESSRIVGYAYASEFKKQAAYQWAVETSIYVDRDHRGKGIGRQLHEALEEALRQQGIRNMNACIAFAEQADEHLTLDSVYFHQRLGYTRAAHFHQCGKKFDHWYDMIWMEKIIKH